MPELQISKPPLLISAAYIFLLSITVLLGWYINNHALIQILPQFAPMQFNTSLGFLFSALGIFAIWKDNQALSFYSGVLVSLLGALTLFQYIFAIDLAIDQLLMNAYITTQTSHPGRMAPNSALCFILSGIALILISPTTKKPNTLIVTEIICLLILALSASALAGYIIDKEKAYAWGEFTRMAIHTSSGFIVLSGGVLSAIWTHSVLSQRTARLWMPALLYFSILMFDLYYPVSVAAGVAYVPLVFFGLQFYRQTMVFVFAGLATVLILLGYLAAPHTGIEHQYVVMNRLLAIMAIWVTAVVVFRQKFTQEKLIKSEEALTLGWRGAGNGMWDWDIIKNITTFSDQFKALLGYKPDEFPHAFEEWTKRIHPDDKEKTIAAINAHIHHNTPYDVEYRLITKTGHWRWFQSKGQALWNATGEPVRMAGSLNDITARKEAEQELRLLKLAVENLKEVVVITEADVENPIITFVNKACFDTLGYQPEEMIGRTPRFLQGEKTDRIKLAALKSALKKNQPFATELINYTKDGNEYWIDINIVPVRDEYGNTSHFAAIERDITASKTAALERERLILALEKSNRELDEFAYVASHDLKAPLRVIENISHWLEEDLADTIDTESRDNLLMLRSRVHRLDKLLDDLLAYSRIGRKLDANYTETISGAALMAEIELIVAIPENFKLITSNSFKKLTLNKMPLQLVLINLIGNAIKHRDDKTNLVTIDAVIHENHYLISVKDNGPGIAPAFHQKIFKMFQTLKPRDRVEGSGMGLTIVRKHIELFNGTITVDSAEGKGSTFKITWPKVQKIPDINIF